MSLWNSGIVQAHSGHYLELIDRKDEVLLICHECRTVVAELTSVGLLASIAALEFDSPHQVHHC